ncbi:MAG: exodeoxyribonuclease VII large subunit, partial [Beijerinckiaceae bacterium]
PSALLAARRGAYTALAARLPDLAKRRIADEKRHIAVLSDRLAHAFTARTALEKRRLQTDAARLDGLERRLRAAMAVQKTHRATQLESLGKLLASLSYRSVLERGFAMVRDGEGRPLMRAAAISGGDGLAIEFADGTVAATAGDIAHGSAHPRTKSPVRKTHPSGNGGGGPGGGSSGGSGGSQGSLF